MTKKLQLGINEYFTDVEYHGDINWLSSTTIKDILKDPNSVRDRFLNGHTQEEKAAFVLGQYAHWKYLEPEKDDAGFAEFGGARRYGSKYDEFRAANEGRTIILREERIQGDNLIKALNSHEIANSLVKNGKAEQTICGLIEDVPIKIRMDYRQGNTIVDLKTTSSPVDQNNIKKTIYNYGYHISAALYMDVANLYLEEKVEQFILVFINKKTAEIQVVKLSQKLIELGRREYLNGIRSYKELKAAGFFEKDYNPGIIEIDI